MFQNGPHECFWIAILILVCTTSLPQQYCQPYPSMSIPDLLGSLTCIVHLHDTWEFGVEDIVMLPSGSIVTATSLSTEICPPAPG